MLLSMIHFSKSRDLYFLSPFSLLCPILQEEHYSNENHFFSSFSSFFPFFSCTPKGLTKREFLIFSGVSRPKERYFPSFRQTQPARFVFRISLFSASAPGSRWMDGTLWKQGTDFQERWSRFPGGFLWNNCSRRRGKVAPLNYVELS